MPPVDLDSVRDLLFAHQGASNALKAAEICELISNRRCRYGTDDRNIREIVVQLRLEGYPIASHSSWGYYWAVTPEELAATRKLLRGRSFHGLKVDKAIAQRAMPDLVGQLRLPVGSSAPMPPAEVVPIILEIPKDLRDRLRRFVDSRPEWDTERAVTAAISLFLTQQGGCR
ncbi:DUF2811 domain-containing protein [Pseudanabaena sp. PCC 6802]|uniref:DUF2811 domain-containing protein n=1 Tax=Pseudanabaena sp. PCC 6802 TaxID=118173 RepID=UPI00034A2B66|nr:DUF2811 domain-containing protein [Pseudanabaena sp. PCC 6802]